MCVALIITKEARPKLADLRRMQCANQDGIGYGWPEDGKVHWKKGVTLEELDEALDTAPRPVFVHFRLATAGGKRAALCHPFPVNAEADIRVVGSAGALMMHNGHWGDWDDWYNALKMEKVPLPDGPWSDTRFTAYMMAHWPREMDSIAKLNGGRVALLRGNGTFSLWGDWKEPQPDGVIYSNYYWQAYTTGSYGYYGNSSDFHEEDWVAWAENGEAVSCTTNVNPSVLSPAQRAINAEGRLTTHDPGRRWNPGVHTRKNGTVITDAGTRYTSSRLPPELEEELTDDEVDAMEDYPHRLVNGHRVPDFERSVRANAEQDAAWEAMVSGYSRE